MVEIIRRLSSLKGAGTLADRVRRADDLEFRRFNLIYGFNGSGKTTLSRLFNSLRLGASDARLPRGCSFEFELSDGSKISGPENCAGLENRLLVFNTDFIEENLQWSAARAKPVFYIGKEQAESARELGELKAQLGVLQGRITQENARYGTADRALAKFKRDQARAISGVLGLSNRSYEAPQLAADFQTLNVSEGCILDDKTLEALVSTCRLEAPPPKIGEPSIDMDGLLEEIIYTKKICEETPSTAALTALEKHESMLVWVKEGYEYHVSHNVDHCLFCDNPIGSDRLSIIRKALDSGVDALLSEIDGHSIDLTAYAAALRAAAIPAGQPITKNLQQSYEAERKSFEKFRTNIILILEACEYYLSQKRKAPGKVISTPSLDYEDALSDTVTKLRNSITALSELIRKHNTEVDDFAQVQEQANISVRKHYCAESLEEFNELVGELDAIRQNISTLSLSEADLRGKIQSLENTIREHGPAASMINKLLHSYLGHSELGIAATQDGYEIHRSGRLIEGVPSEGEKTAIALCYFISTLDSEGRNPRNLIIVIDDPISSLDSRSLIYACSMLKSRLANVAQFFLLTHNQNCLNEFRKDWKSLAYPIKENRAPTAALFFLDVVMPNGGSGRSASVIELPRLLREYDSEYHYFFSHIIRFSESKTQYEYAYLMPNVLRRVLEVFLSFRCPGSSGLKGKIEQICKEYPDLDDVRIAALERLSALESHSDSLDDLISFSSMTVEESLGAAVATLGLIEDVDKAHCDGMRHICR